MPEENVVTCVPVNQLVSQRSFKLQLAFSVPYLKQKGEILVHLYQRLVFDFDNHRTVFGVFFGQATTHDFVDVIEGYVVLYLILELV